MLVGEGTAECWTCFSFCGTQASLGSGVTAASVRHCCRAVPSMDYFNTVKQTGITTPPGAAMTAALPFPVIVLAVDGDEVAGAGALLVT